MAAIGSHASTPLGGDEVRSVQHDAELGGDLALAAYLDACLNVGHAMRDAVTAMNADIAADSDAARHVSTGNR